MDAKIQKLIVKYLSKEANIYEIEELDRWLIKKGNIAIFNNYVQTDYYTSIFLTKYNLQTAKSRIQMRIRLIEKRNKLERFKKLAFAASVSLLIGISLFNQFNFDQTKMINDPIVIGTDKAVLTLENGDQVILEKGKKFQKNNINSNGIELSYSTKNRSSINFNFNKLTLSFKFLSYDSSRSFHFMVFIPAESYRVTAPSIT